MLDYIVSVADSYEYVRNTATTAGKLENLWALLEVRHDCSCV